MHLRLEMVNRLIMTLDISLDPATQQHLMEVELRSDSFNLYVISLAPVHLLHNSRLHVESWCALEFCRWHL